MAIDLPTIPRGTGVTLTALDFGVDQVPPFGGVTQRIDRLGARYSLDLALPKLGEALARQWLAVLLKARATGDVVRCPVPQPAFKGVIGAPLVNGATQTGLSLSIDGGQPYGFIPGGQPFSVIVSGQGYLYVTTGDLTLNGSGAGSLAFAPMLRASPSDNAVLEFAEPKIEGFLKTGDIPLTLDYLRFFGLALSLQERA